jgi:hypothetical protein
MAKIVDRTTSDAWEDEAFVAQVNAAGKDQLVMAGLWTSACCNGPVLSALEQGFDVYVVSDAPGLDKVLLFGSVELRRVESLPILRGCRTRRPLTLRRARCEL